MEKYLPLLYFLLVLLFFNAFAVQSFNFLSRYITLRGYSFYIYYAVIVFLILLVVKHFTKQSLSSFGFALPKAKEWGNAFSLLTILFPFVFLARLIAPGYDAELAAANSLYTISALFSFAVFLVFLTLKSELFFRALLQSGLGKRYGPIITAFLIAAAFTLINYRIWVHDNMYFTITVLIMTFIEALIFALIFEQTKSLLASYVMNLLFSFIFMLQVYFNVNAFVYEYYLWIVLSVLFIVNVRKNIPLLNTIVQDRSKLVFNDWLFFILFALLVPFVLYIF